jgi:hypothetical protein
MMARSRRAGARWIALAAIVAAACDGEPPPSAPTPPPTPAPTVARVDIEGPAVRDLNFLGDTVQLRAFAAFSDGSRTDVTNDAAWSVANTVVLSVTPRGMVTALGYGASAVTASYRERSAEVGVSVVSRLGAEFRITGVVRDAGTRLPIAGARVWRGGADPGAITDADGFFSDGPGVVGPRTLFVSKLGYAFGLVDLPGPNPPSTVDVALVPDPGPSIERTVAGTFDGRDPLSGLDLATHRVVTKPGGLFDAEVVRPDCGPRASLTLEARSGNMRFPATDMPAGCYSRIRFTVPDREILLMVRGLFVPAYTLTFKEPR